MNTKRVSLPHIKSNQGTGGYTWGIKKEKAILPQYCCGTRMRIGQKK